jgi:hypothetical protein
MGAFLELDSSVKRLLLAIRRILVASEKCLIVITSGGKYMPRKEPFALTSATREQQLIAKAQALAEQRIEDGTASSQLITHYLKLGTEREKLERAKLEAEIRKLNKQAEAFDDATKLQESLDEAMRLFRKYNGDKDV